MHAALPSTSNRPLHKVLFLSSTLSRTGPTSQLLNIVKYLDREVFEPVVLTLSPEPPASRLDDFRRLGIPVKSLNLSRLGGAVLGPFMLKRMLRREQPGIVHSQGLRPDTLSSMMASRGARIATLRNYPQHDYAMTYGRMVSSIMTRVHKWALRRIERTVGVSDGVAANAAMRLGIARVTRIHNGVDEALYYPADVEQKRGLRRRLGLPENAFIYVSAGRLDTRKDPMLVLEVFRQWLPREARLILLGNGPLLARIAERVHGDERFRLEGQVTNVLEYLQAADVFVSASLAEGLPNAVLEAMACGLVPVLSDIPPHRELLPPDLQGKLIFRTGDSASLLRSLETLTAHEVEKLSSVIQQHFARSFSARAMSEHYQKLYREEIQCERTNRRKTPGRTGLRLSR